MNLNKYPIINVYSKEIKKLHRHCIDLPLIFLIGTTGELLLREIMDDSKTGFERLIEKANRLSKISHKQSRLFDDIRMYRNKYTHINADKVMSWEISGLFLETKEGLLEHVNEIFLGEFTEENFERVLNLHIAGDSEVAYNTYKELERTL